MAGPAWAAAAWPVRTKMPVPMMAPMPSVGQIERPEHALELASPPAPRLQLVDGFGGEERHGATMAVAVA